MPGRRGPADWVSEADEEKLLADLESYVCTMRTKGLLLWQFGQYDTEVTKLSMEKRAPAISALLDNAAKWSAVPPNIFSFTFTPPSTESGSTLLGNFFLLTSNPVGGVGDLSIPE